MTFDVMRLLDWTAAECAKRDASEMTRSRCFTLIGEVKSKGGTERDAALAVRALLERYYPEQGELPIPE